MVRGSRLECPRDYFANKFIGKLDNRLQCRQRMLLFPSPACLPPRNPLANFYKQLKKYLDLPQKGAVMAEYVWIDGSNGIRSKSKVSFFLPLVRLCPPPPDALWGGCDTHFQGTGAAKVQVCAHDVHPSNRSLCTNSWRSLSQPHDKPPIADGRTCMRPAALPLILPRSLHHQRLCHVPIGR